ncbi:hypothetical protein DFH09DRAFT_1215908 [Mycena vulgaris]|nr:hypothetical protein DFH09DRAFT_1218336 [Mycena vulgaris]KAJ6477470.1 hypothetical protein DFH09DRAFT_1215908 [Mycena vulgaris]
MCLLASFSPLHWVLWTMYTYALLTAICLAPLFNHLSSFYPALVATWYSPLAQSSVIGPTVIIPLGILALGSFLVGLLDVVPFTVASVCHRPVLLLHLLLNCFCLAATIALCSLLVTYWYLMQVCITHPDIQDVLWHHLIFTRSWRNALPVAHSITVRDYRHWKARQIEALDGFSSWLLRHFMAVFKSCAETWCNMGCFQKRHLAPIVVYYGYFYVILTARRVPEVIRNWRRRW